MASGTTTNVYASWNGATEVSAWRVLAGSSSGALQAVATAPKRGFETRITIESERYVAVQALNRAGRVLGTSATVVAH